MGRKVVYVFSLESKRELSQKVVSFVEKAISNSWKFDSIAHQLEISSPVLYWLKNENYFDKVSSKMWNKIKELNPEDLKVFESAPTMTYSKPQRERERLNKQKPISEQENDKLKGLEKESKEESKSTSLSNVIKVEVTIHHKFDINQMKALIGFARFGDENFFIKK